MSHSRRPARDSSARVPTAIVFTLLMLATLAPLAHARPASPPPPFPAPTGTVVNVATDAQLQAAVQHLASNTTIVLAPGTYVLSSTLYVNGSFSNVAIRGANQQP